MDENGILLVPMIVIGAVYLLHLTVAVREVAGRQRRNSLMSAAAAALDAPLSERCTHVMGFVHGLPATFSLRGMVPRVEIDIPSTDLLVIIQPRMVPARPHEDGTLRTGDDAFDAELLVEGAPADVVRCLLTDDVRQHLLLCRPLEVLVSGTTVEVCGQPAHAGDIEHVIDLAARLAEAVPAAVDEADRRLTELAGSPYRPQPDATILRSAKEGRADELAALIETLRDRALAARRALLLAVMLAAFLAISLCASSG